MLHIEGTVRGINCEWEAAYSIADEEEGMKESRVQNLSGDWEAVSEFVRQNVTAFFGFSC